MHAKSLLLYGLGLALLTIGCTPDPAPEQDGGAPAPGVDLAAPSAASLELRVRGLWGDARPDDLTHLCVGVNDGSLELHPNQEPLRLKLSPDKDAQAPALRRLVIRAARLTPEEARDPEAACARPSCVGAELDLRDLQGRVKDGELVLERPLQRGTVPVRLSVDPAGALAGAIQTTVQGLERSCRSDAAQQPAQCELQIPACQELRLAAKADPDGTFLGWGQGACALGPEQPALTLIPGSKPKSGCTHDQASARFGLRAYALQISRTGPGQVRVFRKGEATPFEVLDLGTTSKIISQPARTTLELVFEPAPTALLDGVQGCTQVGGRCDVELREVNQPVMATFRTQQRELAIDVAGPGQVTGPGGLNCRQGAGTCRAFFDVNSDVLLQVPPLDNYDLTWTNTGCAPDQRACTVRMDTSRTVGATFRSTKRQLDVTVGGNGKVTGPGIDCPGTCSASYDHGTPVSLSAAPAQYHFTRWGGAAACPERAPACTVNMNGNQSAAVSFICEPYCADRSCAPNRCGAQCGTRPPGWDSCWASDQRWYQCDQGEALVPGATALAVPVTLQANDARLSHQCGTCDASGCTVDAFTAANACYLQFGPYKNLPPGRRYRVTFEGSIPVNFMPPIPPAVVFAAFDVVHAGGTLAEFPMFPINQGSFSIPLEFTTPAGCPRLEFRVKWLRTGIWFPPQFFTMRLTRTILTPL